MHYSSAAFEERMAVILDIVKGMSKSQLTAALQQLPHEQGMPHIPEEIRSAYHLISREYARQRQRIAIAMSPIYASWHREFHIPEPTVAVASALMSYAVEAWLLQMQVYPQAELADACHTVTKAVEDTLDATCVACLQEKFVPAENNQ